MSTDDDGQASPQLGELRISDDGQVLVYDGEQWAPYKRLPEVGSGLIMREHTATPPNERDPAA